MTDVSPLDPTHAHHGRTGTVTATQLGMHLGLTRQRIAALADVEHVIERLPSGRFDQDACRLAYLKWLRDPARRSARSEAKAEFDRAKAELIKLRIAEKRRDLMPTSEHNALIDDIAGLVLSRLAGFAARCGGRDLAVRRAIDRAVYDLRLEISQAASRMADQRDEPDEP